MAVKDRTAIVACGKQRKRKKLLISQHVKKVSETDRTRMKFICVKANNISIPFL